MKARAGLMQRINASLDLLDAQKRREEEEGRGGAAADDKDTPPTALDLLLASRDEEGKGLTRQEWGAEAAGPGCCQRWAALQEGSDGRRGAGRMQWAGRARRRLGLPATPP